jgi:hypothetical protein
MDTQPLTVRTYAASEIAIVRRRVKLGIMDQWMFESGYLIPGKECA